MERENDQDDIYSDVIMTVVIARVHSVHLMNVEQRQAAADPQTKPPDLGCESACYKLLSTTTTIAIYYYYSARKLMKCSNCPPPTFTYSGNSFLKLLGQLC